MTAAIPDCVPQLTLASQSTATAYRFEGADGSHWNGWAICTVNDATGELAIQSDWGVWAFRWSADPKHLGAPSLTHFIGGRKMCHYLADKLTSRHGDGEQQARERFSPEATVKSWGERIAERWKDERITREERREIGRELRDLRHVDDLRDFIDRWHQIEGHDKIFADSPWEYIQHEPTTTYMVLLHGILPALVTACDAEIVARTAAEPAIATEAVA